MSLRPAIRATKQSFYSWINFVFNRVDYNRVKEVGADRAAAEWALRMGGAVKFIGQQDWTRDYNKIPIRPRRDLLLEAIDMSRTSIIDIGLEHLNGLEHVWLVNLSKCNYLLDGSLTHLMCISDTLCHLDISYCQSITSDGIPALYELKNLKCLIIEGNDGMKMIKELQEHLPHCKIN